MPLGSVFWSIGFGGVSILSACASSRLSEIINDLTKSKNHYEKNVISSETLDVNAIKPGEKFILQHVVPPFKNYSIITIFAERVGKTYDFVNQPFAELNHTLSPTGQQGTSVNWGFRKTLQEKNVIFQNLENTFIPYKEFGLDNILISTDNVKLLMQLTKPIMISGDYGTIRDILKKDYDYSLYLNNVGTVYANIFDCVGKTLYFGAEKIGNKISYDSVAVSAQDIANSEFDENIDSVKISYVTAILLSCGFGVLAFCNLVK